MTVRSGEIGGLIGPNGAGKTTLFDVVAGERRPNSGRVLVGGRGVTRLGPAARSRLGIRRTFQRVQTFGWLSVEENVSAALERRGGGGGTLADLIFFPTRRRRERFRREIAAQSIERCGLASVRTESAGTLPIGIARMVEFARATVWPARLFLLGEPASGLGEEEVEHLGALIQQVRAETGCAVLLAEHNAGFVMKQCDGVVVLALGSKLTEGTPEQVAKDPAVQEAYLDAGAA